MSKNARLIDYRLRLAKYVERRMLCSTFQRLGVFHPLHKYRYVGFGAYYFTDFYLFHKELGIKNMISIEKSIDKEVKSRYEFNKPFNCIEIIYNESNTILPELEWHDPTIAWLDYTDVLSKNIISDIDTICRNIVSGNVIVLTLRLTSESYEVDPDNHPVGYRKIDNFNAIIGHKDLTQGFKTSDLSIKNLPVTYSKIIKARIKEVLYELNSNSTNEFEFKQLFNFKYQDGIPMYSFGGIFIDTEKDIHAFDAVEFEELTFIRTGNEIFEISIPNLTVKEIKYLEGMMPELNKNKSKLAENKVGLIPNIPKKDIERFEMIYQYFPTFTEARIG